MTASTLLRTDDRLALARQRRMLEDTAMVATGGGVLLHLDADLTDAGVWHADVLRSDGVLVRARLDEALGTVAIVPSSGKPPSV